MRVQQLSGTRRPALYMKKALSDVIEKRDLQQLVGSSSISSRRSLAYSNVPNLITGVLFRRSGGASRRGRTSGSKPPLRQHSRMRCTVMPSAFCLSTCLQAPRISPFCTSTDPLQCMFHLGACFWCLYAACPLSPCCPRLSSAAPSGSSKRI